MGLRPKYRRRTLLAAALLSLAIVAGTAGDTAAAPSPGGLAHELARVWPGLQRHDGSFYDYVHPSWDGRYSEAMLGLALMRTGLREGDDRLVASAFRAYRYSFARGDRQVEYESAFETYAMAAGYNVARARLAHDPRFASLRPGWKAWLQHARPSFLGVRRGAFFNKHVVEATAWIELVRTGLSSRVHGSVLSRRNRAAARAADFVNTDVPRLTRRFRGRVGGKPARLLADPAPSPLAYHGLSLGFYARAVRSLGSRARRSARRTLLEAARASLGLAGPDGDVAYAGRSQEQAWALSLTAYGVDVAGSLAGASERGQLRAFGARLRSRLARLHPAGPMGMPVTPALVTRARGSSVSLDAYVDAPAYAGLTLNALEWAAAARHGGASGASRARAPGRVLLPMPGGGLAVVRTSRVWFAVRGAPDPHRDLRSDFGLVGLAVRGHDGWRSVLGPRPSGSLRRGGAGPVLLRGGRRLPPVGGSLKLRRGAVTARAGWGRISYRAVAGGVRLAWRARRGDRFEYSSFFRSAPRQTGPRTIYAPGQRVRASRALRSTIEPGYVSGLDSRLWRARLWLRAPRGGRLFLAIRAG